jgi:protoporphyrinogen oxidase
LDVVPIPGEIDWRTPETSEPIDFSHYLKNIEPISELSDSILRNHTVKQIIQEVFDKKEAKNLIDSYEYRSELDTLRADKALDILSKELGHNSGFYVVKQGFSALIGGLKQSLEDLHVPIFREHEVTEIKFEDESHMIFTSHGKLIRSTNVIVTLPRDAIASLPCFKGLPLLKQVKMRPLVRIYAVFPKINNKVWFEGLNKFICSNKIRFVIPMNPTLGSIMISYTDGKEAEYWMDRITRVGEITVIHECMDELRSLFPDRTIPNPIFHKIHAWPDGCSYWTPGNYDIETVSYEAFSPIQSMPNLYMCGESWSTKQAWVEGALAHAKALVARIST